MPDKKLTDVTDNNVGKISDNEIIKACKNCFHLEVCLKNLTNAFPDTSQEEINLVLMREGCCKNFIDKDLINRLQADIKKLTSGKCVYLSDDETTEYCVEGPCPNYKTVTQIKAEAYKEFAERLANKAMLPQEINDDYAVGLTTIKKNLKEMVGEDNG